MNTKGDDKLIITVLPVLGSPIVHTYDLSPNDEERIKTVDSVTDKMTNALAPEKGGFLFFDDPMIAYNPSNVLGIRIDFVGREDYQQATSKQVKKKMGFV